MSLCDFGTRVVNILLELLTPVRLIRCNGGHLIVEKAAFEPLFHF